MIFSDSDSDYESDDEFLLLLVPAVMAVMLKSMDEVLSMTDDNTSSDDSDVSTQGKMGCKVSEEIGSHTIVSALVSQRQIVSKGVGVGVGVNNNVSNQENKRQIVSKGVGLGNYSNVSTQGDKRQIVSKRIGLGVSTNFSTQGNKRDEIVAKGIGIGVSTDVSLHEQKRKDVAKGIGIGVNSTASTEGKKRKETSKGVGDKANVSTQGEKRQEVSKGVGVSTNISTQVKKSQEVSKGIGVRLNSNLLIQRENMQVPKEIGVGVKLSPQFDVLLDAIANKSIKGKDKPGCSIEEVMQIVEGMPEIVNDDELFMKTADILTERKNREMFVALKEQNRQIMWLKHKKV